MHILLIFAAYMVLFYAIYKIIFWFKSRKKKNDLHRMTEIYLLEHKFKINVKKIGMDKMLNIVALSNSFIFTVVLMSTMAINNLIIRLLVMFVLLIPIIYLVYYGVGKYLKKKGNKDNV